MRIATACSLGGVFDNVYGPAPGVRNARHLIPPLRAFDSERGRKHYRPLGARPDDCLDRHACHLRCGAHAQFLSVLRRGTDHGSADRTALWHPADIEILKRRAEHLVLFDTRRERLESPPLHGPRRRRLGIVCVERRGDASGHCILRNQSHALEYKIDERPERSAAIGRYRSYSRRSHEEI